MNQHEDTGQRCMMAHSDGTQCIKCTCGRWIRAKDWLQHIVLAYITGAK